MDTPFPTATVVRGGQYTNNWVDVKDPECTLFVEHDVLRDVDTLSIRLTIPAAGGGETGVLLRLGAADVSLMLTTLAHEWPAASVALLQAAAQAAVATHNAVAEVSALLHESSSRIDSLDATLSVRRSEDAHDRHLEDDAADLQEAQEAMSRAGSLLEGLAPDRNMTIGLFRLVASEN